MSAITKESHHYLCCSLDRHALGWLILWAHSIINNWHFRLPLTKILYITHTHSWNYRNVMTTYLSEKPRDVLTTEEGEAGAVWLRLSVADWVDERLRLLMLTLRGWVELPPPPPTPSSVDAFWAEPRLGLRVVGFAVGESMWKTNPVLGSAFSDQVSSSMLHSVGKVTWNGTVLTITWYVLKLVLKATPLN